MPHRRTIDGDSITAAGFARLLQRLDADADRAAAAYAELRLALVKFFDWRGAWEPDECADETLDRLAEKLQRETPVDDVRRYAHGIARLVLLESLRRQAQMPITDLADLSSVPAASAINTSELQDCFQRCLADLPDGSRALVQQYYADQGRTRTQNRRRLEQTTGLSNTALRSRVQRIRDRIERCVHDCATQTASPRRKNGVRDIAGLRDPSDMTTADDD